MGKRRTVGVVFVAGFILAATIALFFLDLEMSMRWLGGGSGGGSNLTRVMDAEVIPDADDSAEGGDGDDTADADTRFAGGATRAYAVSDGVSMRIGSCGNEFRFISSGQSSWAAGVDVLSSKNFGPLRCSQEISFHV